MQGEDVSLQQIAAFYPLLWNYVLMYIYIPQQVKKKTLKTIHGDSGDVGDIGCSTRLLSPMKHISLFLQMDICMQDMNCVYKKS